MCIFMIVQCIFCMPSNDAEGMTDEDGDEWLVMNDEEQRLIYLCCGHTKAESAASLAFMTTAMMQAYAGYIIMESFSVC